jgi:hypothetical protein
MVPEVIEPSVYLRVTYSFGIYLSRGSFQVVTSDLHVEHSIGVVRRPAKMVLGGSLAWRRYHAVLPEGWRRRGACVTRAPPARYRRMPRFDTIERFCIVRRGHLEISDTRWRSKRGRGWLDRVSTEPAAAQSAAAQSTACQPAR